MKIRAALLITLIQNKRALIGLCLFLTITIPAISLAVSRLYPNYPPPPADYFLKLNPADKQAFLSPVPGSSLPQLSGNTRKEVIGFLPFWNLSEVDNLEYNDLNLIYYFGAVVNGDGSFDKTEPGWQRMISPEFIRLQTLTAQHNTRLGLAVLNMDQNNIASVITSPYREKLLIGNTVDLMKKKSFTDLNIDFEYIGASESYLQTDFTDFIARFADAVHTEIPGSTISVATLADSANKRRIYDIPALGRIADRIIVMTYDFHRLDSATAGPVAPLFGKERYEYDVYTTTLDYLKAMGGQKLVLGIPFYGYEWPTVDSNPESFVLGASTVGPEVSSYHRTEETIAENHISVNFDDYSKSPWFSYFDKSSGTFRQVWFENERSLGLKLDLVRQAGLSGIAIWALGYDGGDNAAPLWQTIEEKID